MVLPLWPTSEEALLAWWPERWAATWRAAADLAPQLWTLARRLVRQPALVEAALALANDNRLHLRDEKPTARTKLLFSLLAGYVGLISSSRSGGGC